MPGSIEQLNLYTNADAAKKQAYKLVEQLSPDNHQDNLSGKLQCSSAAVVQHIVNVHKLYSYHLKLRELAIVRQEAEITQRYLKQMPKSDESLRLINDYTVVIKQSWGLSRWLRTKLIEKGENAEITAKDEAIVASA